MDTKRKKRGDRGFTLIELMVVIVIIGILAAYIAPKLINRTEDAKITAAKAQIRSFETGLKLFRLDCGFYPSTEQGLQALVSQPSTGRIPERYKQGGYLETSAIPNDPWGNEYIYESPGQHGFDYEIRSLGADGVDGGENESRDIESWNIE
ncbi:MAG: type II secretion system protein GspG [Candidatus Abyssobacteria bacterium SURF_5]|uniref:Type II secretion system core protein G n=1 Tax=Abyssobacteria bacterium (strain SURF_5) TaxID=2093360 RepID=A0A3A4PB33_ABYX5|nr:MAG: type II secretion system protein GspG [Candidatus Abyssubacteria bacterium SURF_5]